MNHWPFIFFSYLAFVILIAWDLIWPLWQMRQQKLQLKQRLKRAEKK